jgi:hypothetical protein
MNVTLVLGGIVDFSHRRNIRTRIHINIIKRLLDIKPPVSAGTNVNSSLCGRISLGLHHKFCGN